MTVPAGAAGWFNFPPLPVQLSIASVLRYAHNFAFASILFHLAIISFSIDYSFAVYTLDKSVQSNNFRVGA